MKKDYLLIFHIKETKKEKIDDVRKLTTELYYGSYHITVANIDPLKIIDYIDLAIENLKSKSEELKNEKFIILLHQVCPL